MSPFREVIDKLFALRRKYKKENNDVIQWLVKLIMNSLYGENIRKDINEKIACKSEAWMMTDYVEQVKVFSRTSHGNYIVTIVDDAELGNEVKKLNTMPLHLGAFALSKELWIILYTRSMDSIQTMFFTQTQIVYILRTNIGINWIELVQLEKDYNKEKTIKNPEVFSMVSF